LRRFLRKLFRWCYRLLAAIGLLTVLVLTTPLVAWWARAYAGPIRQPKGEVLLLLSAAGDNEDGGISYSSYWRAHAALAAWQRGGFKKIVISGGGPGIESFLLGQGIPREAIIAESRSTSTRENAIEAKRLIGELPGRRVLLTSDFHLYRAMRVFGKEGIDAAPMAVPDLLHATEHWNGRFGACETMAIETVKIVYYWLRGWI
jgi:uncharacterized SAM-binding protein YcdF (DUF218 family)